MWVEVTENKATYLLSSLCFLDEKAKTFLNRERQERRRTCKEVARHELSRKGSRSAKCFEKKCINTYKIYKYATHEENFPAKLNIHKPNARLKYCLKPNTEAWTQRNTEPQSKARVPWKQPSNYVMQLCQCLHTGRFKWKPSPFGHFYLLGRNFCFSRAWCYFSTVALNLIP